MCSQQVGGKKYTYSRSVKVCVCLLRLKVFLVAHVIHHLDKVKLQHAMIVAEPSTSFQEICHGL